MISQLDETNDQVTSSAEWNRQKEAELNETLMKITENKLGKYCVTSVGCQDIANNQKRVSTVSTKRKEMRSFEQRTQQDRVPMALGDISHFVVDSGVWWLGYLDASSD